MLISPLIVLAVLAVVLQSGGLAVGAALLFLLILSLINGRQPARIERPAVEHTFAEIQPRSSLQAVSPRPGPDASK